MFQFPESYCCKGSFQIIKDLLRASCDPSDFLLNRGRKVAPLSETLSYECICTSSSEPFSGNESKPLDSDLLVISRQLFYSELVTIGRQSVELQPIKMSIE